MAGCGRAWPGPPALGTRPSRGSGWATGQRRPWRGGQPVQAAGLYGCHHRAEPRAMAQPACRACWLASPGALPRASGGHSGAGAGGPEASRAWPPAVRPRGHGGAALVVAAATARACTPGHRDRLLGPAWRSRVGTRLPGATAHATRRGAVGRAAGRGRHGGGRARLASRPARAARVARPHRAARPGTRRGHSAARPPASRPPATTRPPVPCLPMGVPMGWRGMAVPGWWPRGEGLRVVAAGDRERAVLAGVTAYGRGLPCACGTGHGRAGCRQVPAARHRGEARPGSRQRLARTVGGLPPVAAAAAAT